MLGVALCAREVRAARASASGVARILRRVREWATELLCLIRLKCAATKRTQELTENKAARVHFQERRDARRIADYGQEAVGRTLARDGDPLDIVAGRDLLNRFRQSLGEEERQLAEWRSEGLSWPEIASRLGGTPDARRQQLSRAIDRVSLELGLEE